MNKKSILIVIVLLLLASCAPSYDEREEVIDKTEDDTQKETAIVPSYNISDQYYKTVLPYKPSKSRGVIVDQISNRFDIDEFEQGLRRHSKGVYDPKDYYFQEGQYITEEMVLTWLGREMTDEQAKNYIKENVNTENMSEKEIEEKIKELKSGLNPILQEGATKKEYENSPRYLSHILEQDYLVRKEENTVQLGGVSIGLALKSVYRFQTEPGGPYYYEEISVEKMLEVGKELADQVLQRVRKIDGLENVPVFIALYREEEQGSLVPGNFVAKTKVGAEENSIGKWKSINEEYILFPSDKAKDKYTEDAKNLAEFQRQITEYLPNYVGLIGKGFYIDEKLEELTIEIPIQFGGKAEVVGFTQFAYGLVQEIFKNYFDIEVNIKSNSRQESLIVRKAGEEEPIVHIYN